MVAMSDITEYRTYMHAAVFLCSLDFREGVMKKKVQVDTGKTVGLLG